MFHVVIIERLLDFGDGRFVGHLSVHERASATLLHDFGAVVARNLAEGLRAVDDGIVHNLSVGQQEARIGCKWTKRWKARYRRR